MEAFGRTTYEVRFAPKADESLPPTKRRDGPKPELAN